MLDVCLLGTGGMMPLPGRWLTALVLRYNGSQLLIDCGEGTQVAMKKAGSMSAIIRNIAPVPPSAWRVSRYTGIPTAAAPPKQISWRRVRLKAIFVLILERSLGTFT